MINWQLPIETVNGEPAKLVYTDDTTSDRLRRGIVIDRLLMWVDDSGFNAASSPHIRNVSEPPVKIEGYIGIHDQDADWGDTNTTNIHQKASSVHRDFKYILNLATVSEKCPEAFERVK